MTKNNTKPNMEIDSSLKQKIYEDNKKVQQEKIKSLKAELLMLIDAKDSSSEEDDENFCKKWANKKRKEDVVESTKEEANNVKQAINGNNKKGAHLLANGVKGNLNRNGHPPPKKMTKVDKELKKDNEQRPLPQLLKQVLVSYPAEGPHYSLVMGRDLLSLEPESPLSANLLRFGLLYILQKKVSKTFRSSVVLFDNATFGTIDRYPKLKEAEKKKFREHHPLGDKEYLVFLVRMDNPKNSALAAQKQQQQIVKKGQKQKQTSQSKTPKGKQKRKIEEDDDDDEIDEFDEDGSSVELSGSEDAENQRWHWYLAIVTDITAYQGPPITGSSALYSTIIFLDANPSLGAAHYKWASAGVRGYLHDIYEDLHGIEIGVRLNYRYPRLTPTNSSIVNGSNHDNLGSLIVKNRQNHTYTEVVKPGENVNVNPADSGLLLLAYFEAFMRKDLFRERAAKGVPLGAICVFPRNAPTFDGLVARLAWRVALFSVIDFSEAHFSRERLLKQLRWTEKMVDQKELEKAGVKC